MSSLKDLAVMTGQLDKLTTELHSELTEGPIDFRKMVELADNVGQQVDRLASAFSTMADALDTSLNGTDAEESGRNADTSDSE